jgi:hypothetical protein
MVVCKSCSVLNASYGYKKGGDKEFCNICAKSIPNLINLNKKMCLEENCIIEPNYNLPTETCGRYCKNHKKENMIDVKHKKCEYVDKDNNNKCLLNPSYGIIGKKATRCLEHKEDNMILIRNDLCKYKNGDEVCTSRASFNFEGVKNGKYCQNHKENGMIFVLKIETCNEDGCKVRAIYNYLNEKKGIYCEAHKKENMYNIKDKRCENENCVKIASYNYNNQKEFKYCDEHKLENMVNLKSKKCEYIDENGIRCKLMPTFNFSNETIKKYCGKHKENEMINVKHNTCIFNGCDKLAYCNYENETKRLYCCSHKLNNMVDLCTKRCKYNETSCCGKRANKKYDGYCVMCYVHLFPNEPRTRNYKTKEYKVNEFIKKYFTEFTILYDKIIPDGCSKRRPDIYIDMGSHSIIIEVDENQHDGYENICENKRSMLLFNDLGNRPMVLIRFNPDDYYNKKGELIKSCWSLSKERIAIINRTKKDEWNNRLNTLKDYINYYINNKPEKELEIKNLYYDNFI